MSRRGNTAAAHFLLQPKILSATLALICERRLTRLQFLKNSAFF